VKTQNTKNEKKTVLVAGGAGFIGSHLCEALLAKGSRVICVDNLCTGTKENISHLFSNKNFVFLEQDVTKSIVVSEKINVVFNLASPASPKKYLEMPIETLLVGAVGTKNLLDLALKNNSVFLQASTSEVYGDPLQHPQKEEYWGNVNPIGERSCYDESKRFAEAIVMAYHRKFGLQTRIARIFNTFGPRLQGSDGRVVSNFVFQSLSGKDITVFGDGKQTRSFCFVSDTVKGLILLSESDYSLPINIGNPEERTILDFAEAIKKITKSNSKIVFKPLPKDDPTRRKPDISVAKKVLGWQPNVSFEEAIGKTIDFFKNQKQ
jgi:dTDP-glucose 4,6-dehydratase